MKQIYTEIEINSDPLKIWEILTEFEKYSDWNPFIISIEGTLKVGNKLKVSIRPPDSEPMTFKPFVKKVVPGKQFSWRGNLIIPGLFEGEHIFELKKQGKGQTLLIHRENFNGLLVSMLWKKLQPKTQEGFQLMNQKIKERAEMTN